MIIKFIDKKIKYDGLNLSPHYIFKNFDILGTALVSFIGEADVSIENMVDLIDVKDKKNIFSESMLHFLGEFYEYSFKETGLECNKILG